MKIKIIKRMLNFISILILTLTFSCKKKTYFSDRDLIWISPYNIKDTIIFQNTSTLDKDTIIITKKEVYHSDFQPSSRGGLIPHTAKIWYENKSYFFRNNIKKAMIIEMYKNNNTKGAEPWINFLGSSFMVDNESLKENTLNLSISNKLLEKVIKLNSKQNYNLNNINKFKPKTIYWDKNFGIVKYETILNEEWERINW